jgi:oligopeptide/dipeptide ABC transporter ATP-binding protein
MMQRPILEVKNLSTTFHTFRGIIHAVSGVSFHLNEGEILGIVGESGSGKTVANLSLLHLVEGGVVQADVMRYQDIDLSSLKEKEMEKLRGAEISMIFQDPMSSLNPLYTIGHQIEESLKLHTKLNRKERRARMIDLLSKVGISDPESRLKSYPFQYSGGMRQRIIIAIALAVNPKIIIADEPTTALDVTVQAQVLRLLTDLIHNESRSMILITHDLGVVSKTTDRVVVMYAGKAMESGITKDVIHEPMHPYTDGLLRSIPRFHENQERLYQIPGMVPRAYDLPKGCRFEPRCPKAQPICKNEEPPVRKMSNGREIACFFPISKG